MMERYKEYGIPWLWKRVPVGTWVKGASWLIEGGLGCVRVGVLGTYVDYFGSNEVFFR